MSILEQYLSANTFRLDHHIQTVRTKRSGRPSDQKFRRAKDALRKYLDRLSKDQSDEYRRAQHNAIIGDEAAKEDFLSKIELFLLENPEFQNISYPPMYDSLKEALFEEELGFGALRVWLKNPTRKATINGTSILVEEKNGEWVEQPYRFESLNQVDRVIRAIKMGDPNAKHSALSPTFDTALYDGTRVTIWDKPFVEVPNIELRQYPMNKFSFEELARLRTIGREAIPFFKLLSNTPFNIAVTGPVGAGKTTFLKVMFASTQPGMKVMSIETDHYEINLRRDFPERKHFIMEAKMDLQSMQNIFPRIVRSDARLLLIPEIRSHETELAQQGIERGGKHVWLTFHEMQALNMPSQFARLILNGYPQRDYYAEYIRAASNLHIVIALDYGDDGRLVLTDVYAYDFDENSLELSLIPWIRYDLFADAWTYNAQLPKRLVQRIERAASRRTATHYSHFVKSLQDLANRFPMSDPNVQVKSIRGGF